MKKYLFLGFVLVVLFMSGCQNQVSTTGRADATPATTTTPTPSPSASPGFCGNDNIDSGEKCDGHYNELGEWVSSQLGGKTCTSPGLSGGRYKGGTLYCYPPTDRKPCTFDTRDCYK